MDDVYELINSSLYGTELRIYDRKEVYLSICLSIKLLAHISFWCLLFRICIWQRFPHNTDIYHNGKLFRTYAHNPSLFSKHYRILEQRFHKQLAVWEKSSHKDMAEADCKWRDIFYTGPNDNSHHKCVFHSSAF